VDQFDRALTRVVAGAVRRGLARQRRGKPRLDVMAMDFSRPLPARETRIPGGVIIGLVVAVGCFAALLLARLLRAG
jgi:hypothetical protein